MTTVRSLTELPILARRNGGNGDSPLRPLLAGLPQFCLALVVLAVGVMSSIPWPWLLVVAGSLAVAAMWEAGRAAVELGRRRRAVDEWLLWGATVRPSSPLLSWRAGELTSPRLRSTLARSLLGVEQEALGVAVPGPVPLNRRAIRAQLSLLRSLREQVGDLSRPVSARGMVLVDRLLTEPGSPLYSSLPDDVLADVVCDALAAINPLPAVVAA